MLLTGELIMIAKRYIQASRVWLKVPSKIEIALYKTSELTVAIYARGRLNSSCKPAKRTDTATTATHLDDGRIVRREDET
jgi:hypothetical protein